MIRGALSKMILLIAVAAPAPAAELPPRFVYLSDIDPSIAQDIRYAGKQNFTGGRVPGYLAAECILATPVAEALRQVQADLQRQGLGLLVWDCYRPRKAVARFVAWTAEGRDTDERYHPRIRRDRLVAEGYIGAKSGHSSGGTVDLTLVRNGKPVPMGTDFDFFDPRAFTDSREVSPEAAAGRKTLVDAMARRGFRNYRREWWHFRFVREPFAGRSFDFDIAPRQ